MTGPPGSCSPCSRCTCSPHSRMRCAVTACWRACCRFGRASMWSTPGTRIPVSGGPTQCPYEEDPDMSNSPTARRLFLATSLALLCAGANATPDYDIGGVSIGLEAGGEGGAMALVLNNQKAMTSFMQDNKFSLNA